MPFFNKINTESPDIGYSYDLGREAVHQSSKYGRVRVTWDNPNEAAPWTRKGGVLPYSPGAPSVHCGCCCFGIGGNGKQGVVLLIIGLALSFFVGLYYTFKSLRKAREMGEFEDEARTRSLASPVQLHKLRANNNLPDQNPEFTESKAAQFPPFQAPYVEPARRNPPSYLEAVGAHPPTFEVVPEDESQEFNPQEAKNKILQNSALLFASVKHERQITFVSQAMMTLGAGFLTAALVVVLVTEPHFVFIALGSTGAGLVIIGAVSYGVKHALLSWKNEQRLAQEISDLLNKLQLENYWNVQVSSF